MFLIIILRNISEMSSVLNLLHLGKRLKAIIIPSNLENWSHNPVNEMLLNTLNPYVNQFNINKGQRSTN